MWSLGTIKQGSTINVKKEKRPAGQDFDSDGDDEEMEEGLNQSFFFKSTFILCCKKVSIFIGIALQSIT